MLSGHHALLEKCLSPMSQPGESCASSIGPLDCYTVVPLEFMTPGAVSRFGIRQSWKSGRTVWDLLRTSFFMTRHHKIEMICSKIVKQNIKMFARKTDETSAPKNLLLGRT